MAVIFKAIPSGRIHGDVRVPGDKSISHRSIMLGSIATGVTHVRSLLTGIDVLATLQAFRAMGVRIEQTEDALTIYGVGQEGLKAPQGMLDLGNSGTAIRLMMGLLSGQKFSSGLTGDTSLRSRPMQRIVQPLSMMGAQIETNDGNAPLTINPQPHQRQPLKAIDYHMPMASAQVKSAVLLAGLYAKGQTCVTEPAPTRDHTERMLRGFGYAVLTNGNKICLTGGTTLQACDIDVPADISSAAFFMVAALISPGSKLCLRHVGVNPTRRGIIQILLKMGANISLENKREVGGEPVADIIVRSSELHGIDIPEKWVPLAIDELPVVAIAAACAQGRTRLSGAEELRVKESDRIMAIVSVLNSLGVEAQETPDGFVIAGHSLQEAKAGSNASIFSGAQVDSFGDHRIAMAASIASLRSSGTILINNCDNVSTSFPGYVEMAKAIGLNIQL